MSSGFLLIDKPKGPTSFGAIGPIRHFYKPLRVGFAGTLDPEATGLLIVGVGKATRLLQYLEAKEKTYRFDIIPGKTTDTYDLSGRILARSDPSGLSRVKVENAMKQFTGLIDQRPPAYSAVKIRGKRACDRARAGESVSMASRKVTISKFELLEWSREVWTAEVICSKGTYVRSLAHELGQALGCGAAANNIRRLAIGSISVSQAVACEPVENIKTLLDIEWGVADMPSVHLAEDHVRMFVNGGFVSTPGFQLDHHHSIPPQEVVSVFSAHGKLLGLGKIVENQLMPTAVLGNTEKEIPAHEPSL